jgi:hypothetical protein
MSVKDTKGAAKERAKDGLSAVRNIMAITGNIFM